MKTYNNHKLIRYPNYANIFTNKREKEREREESFE